MQNVLNVFFSNPGQSFHDQMVFVHLSFWFWFFLFDLISFIILTALALTVSFATRHPHLLSSVRCSALMTIQLIIPYYSVATNLENLEYSGFSEHGKLGEFCATSGKNCNKQSIFSLSFKYLCKTAVDWVNRIIRNRDEVRVRWWPVILMDLMWDDPWWRSLLRLLFVAITYGKVSLCFWKSLENSGNFFLLILWPLCIRALHGPQNHGPRVARPVQSSI